MIRNIVFDFGGVLVDWNPRYLYDPYFGDAERSRWFIDNICTGEWNATLDGGKPFDVGVEELTALHPEWADAIAAYRDRWIEMIGGEVPHTAALVRRLKSAGYGVYGLTNWSAETFPMVRARYGIFDELQGIVVSGEEHLLKPDPRIYRVLLSRYGLEAGESLFLDDNEANVEGARAVGMASECFVSAEQAEQVLRGKYGLKF